MCILFTAMVVCSTSEVCNIIWILVISMNKTCMAKVWKGRKKLFLSDDNIFNEHWNCHVLFNRNTFRIIIFLPTVLYIPFTHNPMRLYLTFRFFYDFTYANFALHMFNFLFFQHYTSSTDLNIFILYHKTFKQSIKISDNG